MNAKRNSTVFVALTVLLGALGPLPLVSTLRAAEEAAPNSSSAQPAAGRELSRKDVDALLRQARTAIKEGNLDQADVLLTRAENAGVHYPIFHFGATPSSVRREFTQAARKSGAVKRPPAGQQSGSRFASGALPPQADGKSNKSTNPFEGRSLTPPPIAASNMPLPAGPSSQPLPPISNSSAQGDPVSVAASVPESIPTLGRAVANPFAGATSGAEAGSVDPNEQAAEANGATSVAERERWQLPDAPLPPNVREIPSGLSQPNGLAAPQRSAYQVAAEAGPSARRGDTNQKQQVQDRMQSARQAMAAGDLDLAEKLVREASAAGVSESQFLPDEDRPSQLAWDIVRARQSARGAEPAVATLPPGASRYAQQAGQAPVTSPYRVKQAAGAEPAFDSNERWAMVPESLSLPPESAPPASETPAPLPRRVAQVPQPVAQLPLTNEAADLLDAGEAALQMHDRKSALELLNQAHVMRDQLDPADRDRLQEHLHMLATEPVDRQIPAANAPPVTRTAELPPMSRPTARAARPTPDSYLPPDAPAFSTAAAPNGAPLVPFKSEGSPFESDDVVTDTPNVPPESSPPSTNSSFQLSDTPATSPEAPSRNSAAQPQEFEISSGASGPRPTPPAANPSLLESASQSDEVLAKQLSAEVGKRQSEAQRLLEKDPDRARAILEEAQQLVKDSQLSSEFRRDLLARIEITLTKTDKYISDHRAEIELDRANEAVMDAVERDRDLKAKLEQKKAELVEQFSQLRDEQRFAEMEIVARRLYELAPDDPVARITWDQAKFIRREHINRQVTDDKENYNWTAWNDVEQASIGKVHDNHEVDYGDKKYWDDFVKKRVGSRERTERRTQRELEIERRLKTPVMLKYQETPLSQVMDGLSAMTGINIHLDPRGLSQEGVHSDTPITINLGKEVQLKSALNLILGPLHLSYVVKDEVLKVTSEQLRDGEIYAKIYNVADLVIPIPNFVPNSNIGLQGLINDAHSAMGYGNNGFGGGPAVLVSDRGRNQGATPPTSDVVAQQLGGSPTGSVSSTVPIGAGPGGMGGGANADFDSLIDLIVSTVSTETWAENGGGEAEIRPFPTNLSIVISQTQAVHEEIADLLEQLRRLQDLQITIEVRFIRLSDRFFERIGVDFQLNIEDRTIGTADLIPGQPFEPGRQSATVGLQSPVLPTNPFPNYTADLDIPFRQSSFAAAQIPPFGPGAVQGAATFGFAILSDLEAFFLIEAAQSDSRTNILNAPKVTLFNGQQAFVADTTQRPFVVGVIPVVGEFVAAQQPVIVVLNEGTMMTIQAVVSDDRRYIRLTVVPFFTQIGEVDEFTFEGASSTTSSSSVIDDDDDGKVEEEDESESESRSGVTVQLPAFSFVSVVTTVSVPDGGTVLLGGIKRLSEGRNEFGVPLLSKIPYIDRLFRNISIGRTTESLMMMVTPRIIIQEEEEERLGIATP